MTCHHLVGGRLQPPQHVPKGTRDIGTVSWHHLLYVYGGGHGRYPRAYVHRNHEAVVPGVDWHQLVHHDVLKQPNCLRCHDE
ncbi:hypothetical protein ACH4FX_30175 [Streptomyces sp. NPDC018019]|uniref:hypothetical protein n=1 Tax=Streptomyces sp. NPDC018019 TaxID=3365030 RepID=UPI00379502AA